MGDGLNFRFPGNCHVERSHLSCRRCMADATDSDVGIYHKPPSDKIRDLEGVLNQNYQHFLLNYLPPFLTTRKLLRPGAALEKDRG